jgi:hypothetical protein
MSIDRRFSQVVLEHVLPGCPAWHVFRLSNAIKRWPAGWYGLMRGTDLLVSWRRVPTPNPLFLSGIEEIDQDDPQYEAALRYTRCVEELEKRFRVDPRTGYEFIQACQAGGYEQAPGDGYNPLYWFVHRMGLMLKEGNSVP